MVKESVKHAVCTIQWIESPVIFHHQDKNLPKQDVGIDDKKEEEEDMYDVDVEAKNANEEDKQNMTKNNVIYYFDIKAENEGEHHCIMPVCEETR